MTLSHFITANLEEILREWEAFARTLLPGAETMSQAELRDHAQQMLEAIALDLATSQSDRQRDQKAKGLASPIEAPGEGSAAAVHGGLREASGFTLQQLIAEFRALRAGVLKLWLAQGDAARPGVAAELMRFNEAVDQALAESVARFAEHTARTRDTFLAMLGHDLRGPLASMTLAGEFLLGPDARKVDLSGVGNRVKRSAATMTAMVRDLLEYARTQLGGKMPLAPHAANLRSVALNSLRDAGATHPDCAFELEAEGDLDGVFDAVRMQQVITNLLANACQYRDKHFSVNLALAGQEEELVVKVRNRGPVIPDSALEAIFDPMVQLVHEGEPHDRPTTSMGLGLFIAREITESHGGTVTVSSNKKQGTVFTVTIPRRPA